MGWIPHYFFENLLVAPSIAFYALPKDGKPLPRVFCSSQSCRGRITSGENSFSSWFNPVLRTIFPNLSNLQLYGLQILQFPSQPSLKVGEVGKEWLRSCHHLSLPQLKLKRNFRFQEEKPSVFSDLQCFQVHTYINSNVLFFLAGETISYIYVPLTNKSSYPSTLDMFVHKYKNMYRHVCTFIHQEIWPWANNII